MSSSRVNMLPVLYLQCPNDYSDPAQPREDITVTLQDGSERKAKSWETSPMDVAKQVSKSLSERIVIAKACFLSTIHPPLLSILCRSTEVSGI